MPPRFAAWDRASPRERAFIAIGALVVVAALGWTLAWQPLTREIAALRDRAPRDAAALAQARALAQDIASLERASAPARPDLRASVERVLAEQGLQAPAATVEASGERVRVVAAAVPFTALAAALDAARKDAAYVVEGTITPRVEPGTVRAELVLAR